MRTPQPAGERGSLKWMQRAVAERWDDLETPILACLGHDAQLDWVSPLEAYDYAEYRDATFLERIGLASLAPALLTFWPQRGPQWDALAITVGGQVLLVEAKAHVREFLTPATAAGEASRVRIAQALAGVAERLGSTRGALWPDLFYQYANRLAHLWFLRDAGIDARLVLVGFVGDAEMGGPDKAETWKTAYALADYALGLKSSHPLTRSIIHVFPEVHK